MERARGLGAVSTWIGRPAGAWGLLALAAVLAAPWWLMADELRSYVMSGDDFAYVGDALDWPDLRANLLKPHNTHVVPLFRLWTFLLVLLAGRLENLPDVLGAAAYLGLVATMTVTGSLVARESRRAVVGLLAMAGLGVSTVVTPAVEWYSAGQALWAGAAVVVTLILADNWSSKGGAWRLVLVVLGAVAASAVWSGGLIAGPAAAVYLAFKNPSRARGPALALLAATAGSVLVVMLASRNQISENKLVWERHAGLWPRPIQAVFHSAQAVAEMLVLGNLGLDAITGQWQAIVLVLALAGFWAWTRGTVGPGRAAIHPLEAAGATVVVGSYLLVYVFRGNLPFSSLRPVNWYNAIPQVGAVVFAAGWWSGLRPAGRGDRERLTRGQALAVVGVVGVLCVLQAPRAERAVIADPVAPPLTATEALRFPVPELQRLRVLYFKAELRDRQLRSLARLDKANRIVAELGAGPEALRRVFGRLDFPGIPPQQVSTDPFSLLRLPPDDPSVRPDPARIHAALDHLVLPEPRPRPPWLDPAEPWPPPQR